ncbi:MAG: flagellar hook protein FlgE [Actinomycetota bacterium]|jgi:flagellar hook protein FlgE|nr:flagellar hook protein FlgE [Actinomycetota bacterium]
MLRSMFAGVSGLRSHQAYMDIVGNNIANVNTTGYKSSSALFEDLLSQSLRGAGAPADATQGGTNPAQVGLGVKLGAVQMNMAQGASQLTGRSTDFAIQGDGLFVVDVAGTRAYTRAGSFSLDGLGQLVTPEGGFLQGWQADSQGNVNTNAGVGLLKVPVGQTIAPVTTKNIVLGGNLPSETATAATLNVSPTIYNSLGTKVPIRVEFTKIANGAATINWQVRTYDAANNVLAGPTALTFDLTGERTTPNITLTQAQLNAIAGTSGTWPAGGIVIGMGLPGAADRMTGASGLNSAGFLSQDGSGIGSLVSFSVSQQGLISGVFSNGRNQALGQMALAVFANPTGLEKAGNSLYRSSVNSGEPQIGIPGGGGRGTIAGGTLEMSNVDLAGEFTNLIVAQRGFQANSRIITASDEILQDLVNLKR